MTLEDGNTEFIYDAENPVKAVCTITSYNGSGAFVAAVGVCDGSSYKTQDGEIKIKVTPTSLQYEMTTAWKEPFLDSGLWDIHNFNYDLSITCTIRVDARIDRFTYRVSSIVPQDGFCMEKIPRLTIKWGCLAEGTEILMADGTQKKVQDLLIGDLIKTVSGSARVKNMWLGTEEGCVRITADNGRELVITRGHTILAHTCAKLSILES